MWPVMATQPGSSVRRVHRSTSPDQTGSRQIPTSAKVGNPAVCVCIRRANYMKRLVVGKAGMFEMPVMKKFFLKSMKSCQLHRE